MGLSLIALTIAIHAISVTFMVFVLHSFRVRLESRNPACRVYRDRNRDYHYDRTAAGSVAYDRGCVLGGNLFVAWCARVAGGCREGPSGTE
jgi:hypothetical protein